MDLQVNVPAFVCLSNLLSSRLVRVYKPDEGQVRGSRLGGSWPLYIRGEAVLDCLSLGAEM